MKIFFHFLSNKTKGFTLIELLVVVTIITILTAVGLTNYSSFTKKARDSRRKADLEAIRGALELYRADEGVYPDTLDLADCGEGTEISNGPNIYMTNIPCDPSNPDEESSYIYNRTNPLQYTLTACLEIDPGSGTGCASCGELNAYCVKNP